MTARPRGRKVKGAGGRERSLAPRVSRLHFRGGGRWGGIWNSIRGGLYPSTVIIIVESASNGAPRGGAAGRGGERRGTCDASALFTREKSAWEATWGLVRRRFASTSPKTFGNSSWPPPPPPVPRDRTEPALVRLPSFSPLRPPTICPSRSECRRHDAVQLQRRPRTSGIITWREIRMQSHRNRTGEIVWNTVSNSVAFKRNRRVLR